MFKSQYKCVRKLFIDIENEGKNLATYEKKLNSYLPDSSQKLGFTIDFEMTNHWVVI